MPNLFLQEINHSLDKESVIRFKEAMLAVKKNKDTADIDHFAKEVILSHSLVVL
jgi:hypothetical protein